MSCFSRRQACALPGHNCHAQASLGISSLIRLLLLIHCSHSDVGLQWLKEGKVHYVDDVTNGLENAPKAFIGMLHGENVGKAAVKVAEH